MALISRLICPRELAPKLVALVRELMRRVDRFAKAAMEPAEAQDRLSAKRAGLANAFGTVEAMRASAFFESADVRLLNEPLQRVTHAAVDFYAVANEAAARPGAGPHAISPQVPEASIANTNGSPRENAEVVSALLREADRRAVASARLNLRDAGVALDGGKSVTGRSPAAGVWSDPLAAALTGIRSALAVAITTAFWFATAWPSGPIAVIVAGVACTLLALMEQPEKTTVAAALTILVAATPVYLTLFHLALCFGPPLNGGGPRDCFLDAPSSASSDDVGHAFQSEAGHLFQSEAGQRSDLMSATGVLLPQVGLDDVLIDGVGQVVVVKMAALFELFQFQNR